MRITLITIIYLLFPFLIVICYQRFKFVRSVGTVMTAYAVGLLMALSGISDSNAIPAVGEVQGTIMSLSVPIAIPLMLFGCNFRLWTRSLPKTLLALVGGLMSIITAIILAFIVFRNAGIGGLNRIAGLMVGIYTGGTLNFFALGQALRVDETIILLVYAFEMLVTFPLILFIVAGGYKVARRLLPFPDEQIPDNAIQDDTTTGAEDYSGMLSGSTLLKTMGGLALSVLMLAVAAGLSLLLTGVLNEMVIILAITAMAIAASFSGKVRAIPKTFELGMILILMFSIVVASKFDVGCLNSSALALLGFIIFIMLTAVLLHLLFCRIFKVSGDLFTVANIGLLCSPPFVPPVVGAMGNRKVLISGIIIGLVGYAVGTYLGVAMAYILELF